MTPDVQVPVKINLDLNLRRQQKDPFEVSVLEDILILLKTGKRSSCLALNRKFALNRSRSGGAMRMVRQSSKEISLTQYDKFPR